MSMSPSNELMESFGTRTDPPEVKWPQDPVESSAYQSRSLPRGSNVFIESKPWFIVGWSHRSDWKRVPPGKISGPYLALQAGQIGTTFLFEDELLRYIEYFRGDAMHAQRVMDSH